MTDDNADPQDDQPTLVVVRSTISLPGVRLGAVGEVDTSSPYIAACLERGYLVPVAASEDASPAAIELAEAEADDDAD